MRISDWSSDVCSSDLVEARFRGGARWYGARVTAKNRDGTYDLHYDDGDDERRIDTKLIRRVGGVSGMGEKGVDKLDEPRETFRVGQRVRSEEHTSELQSLMRISSAVFCLKKKKKTTKQTQKHYTT